MLRRNGLIYLMLIFLFSNCTKEDSIFQGSLSDEETLTVLKECSKNQLKSKDEITKNLIGEWKLVAYGCGFCVPIEEPKATLKMDESTGILDLEYGGIDDTLMTFDWILEDTKFITTPSHFALQIKTFCEDYMLFDNRASDGIMMIYQKQ